MKKEKVPVTINLYVNGTPYGFCALCDKKIQFPEDHLMPLQALKNVKKEIDEFVKKPVTFFDNYSKVLAIETVSIDIIVFVYKYSKKKNYEVNIIHNKKYRKIETIIKEFDDKVGMYVSRVTR